VVSAAKWISLFAVFTLTLFLAACGGPKYRTRVIETPATRGMKPWEKPYEVNGDRYEPLRKEEARPGYTEEGVASWYGKDFHGRRTSNGEVYDMYGRTAAHKTLPLGVYVKVTNLGNGREAIARINDRGPFVKNRIIDLSYTLAKELEIVAAGTAPVRVEALGFRETEAGRVFWRQPKSYAVDHYAIQVGSFSIRSNADRLAAQMQSSHGAASVQEGWVAGKLFYRVRVGDYRTIEAAEAARFTFEQGGYPNSFVVAVE
jgi:rare lipoprotein A